MKTFKVSLPSYETVVDAEDREGAIKKAIVQVLLLDRADAYQILPEPREGGASCSERTCIFCSKEHTPEYMMSMAFMEDHNFWDRGGLDEVIEVIKDPAWSWASNGKCKYITVHIDMRNGACIIRNKQGERISPRQLKWQYSEETPDPIKDEEAYKNENTEDTKGSGQAAD